jgi:hypothetical protein
VSAGATPPPSEVADSPLKVVLPFIALVDYGLSFVLPRALVSRAAAQLPAVPSDADILKASAPGLIIQYALLEFVTLLGLVHAMVVQNPNAGLPYAALGILGTLMARPTPERLRGWCLRRPSP